MREFSSPLLTHKEIAVSYLAIVVLKSQKQSVETALDIRLRACYFPAFSKRSDLEFYKKQSDWHLAPLGNLAEVTFPENDTEAQSSAKTADVIFFWKKEAYWGAKAAHRRKGLVVDEYAQQAVGDNLDAFMANYVKPDYAGHKTAFFDAIRSHRPDIKRAIIIGSGPDMSTLETLTSKELNSTLSLYLSTSVLNEQACKACPPDIIIAVDGPSQFGPSDTAHRYRERAVELARKYKSLILVPAQHLPSIRTHWPADIQENVFAVPLVRKVKAGHKFNSSWEYEPTSNVLTSFGLPCAASLTDNIQFAGVSVRPGPESINERIQHWSHIDEALYQRHVAPMIAMHPASGQDNAGYLDRHHARLTQDLSAHAAAGLNFSHLGDTPLSIQPLVSEIETVQNLPIKVRFFEAIAKAEHYPGRIIISVFILFGLLGMALQYTIGKEMTGFLIAGGLAALLAAGLLFLRLRQNRMSARLESKLSQQQAQQFANLSERLEALERKK